MPDLDMDVQLRRDCAVVEPGGFPVALTDGANHFRVRGGRDGTHDRNPGGGSAGVAEGGVQCRGRAAWSATIGGGKSLVARAAAFRYGRQWSE